MQKDTHARRVRSLIVISVMTAVIVSVSTYAWFIGMKSVAVSAFDVTIKVTESLKLSFDGVTWEDQEITLDMDKIKKLEGAAGYYTNDTNKWSELIPLSTVGEMDLGSSRMKLFEKTSYTPTEGGYRLISKQVVNNGATEGNGYLVFDMFIRNYTGEAYDSVLDENAEEAIYLVADSTVKINQTGGVEGTGVENAIRVAFAQIGRVKGAKIDEVGYNSSLVTGITCATAGDVTGICRTAQIWEPNDTKHVDAAKNYYLTSCIKRGMKDSELVYGPDVAPATNECNTISEGTSYDTYAVRTEITGTDKIDVYDGEDYNFYTGNTYDETNNTTGKLMAYQYFKDSDKIKTKADRPQFMTLAANSVTKVRVYIYIEGQDIDASNFSEIGKKISINFGFTKERFNEDEIITP